jgi:hypothetical protein
MSKFAGILILGVLFAMSGCKDHDKDTTTTDAKMMSADACAACPGVQTATADGHCPVCGAKVSH